METIQTRINQLIYFFDKGVWEVEEKALPKTKKFLLTQLRVLLLTGKAFTQNKCVLRASALTFYSLLSIVPIIAMAFGIAKGFGLEGALEREMKEEFANQPSVFNQAFDFAHNLLTNTSGGVIAGLGLLLLLYSVLKLFNNIEDSFNAIWNIQKGRTLIRKFTDYMTFMIISPVLFVLASSVTVFISSQIEILTQKFELLGFFGPVIFLLLELLPYSIIWLLLSLLYIVIPNINVKIQYGITAGIIAGTAYQATQWFYINFQIGVAKANAIYGSFAALPLFLAWLQLSWLIVLFGAQFSCCAQHYRKFVPHTKLKNINPYTEKLIALVICQFIIKRFEAGEKAPSATEISKKLELPFLTVENTLKMLIKSKLISDVRIAEKKTKHYQPALDIGKIDLGYAIQSIEKLGKKGEHHLKGEIAKSFSHALEEIENSMHAHPSNKLLKDM
ncbi:YihY/virulence factor BrkB family protein [Flexithrix dorotheae]|uniref:YihY/virulence factor BrkB family protein n=1 Tax=Flexithrix dorotheae TaxID=70993 RepID=UPI000367772B|nr:YihY/virulence factor BrkB family protein [Flexithrix dorotheae]